MRPVYPKMGGALYRPTTTAACGTTTAVDDSLGYKVIKFTKGENFQKGGWLDRIYKMTSGFRRFDPVHPEISSKSSLIFPNAGDRMTAG